MANDLDLIIGSKPVMLTSITINLVYDAVASSFTAKIFSDTASATHRNTIAPGNNSPCKIVYKGVRVITGTVISAIQNSAGDPPKQDITLTGYSQTGILENCTFGVYKDYDINPQSGNFVSGQFDKLSTRQIVERVCDTLKLKVIVDKELVNDPLINEALEHFNISPDDKMADFLSKLCAERGAILSHDNIGRVLLTRVKTNKITTTKETFVKSKPTALDSNISGAPENTRAGVKTTEKSRPILWDFGTPGKAVKMTLTFDGQNMHRIIQVVGQQGEGNAKDHIVTNPYVKEYKGGGFNPGLRFLRVKQKHGEANQTATTARMVLAAELKNIVLTIEVEGWTLGGHLITPNQLVTVKNPEVNCYNRVTWFIHKVELTRDANIEKAVLTCLLPECFNLDEVKKILG